MPAPGPFNPPPPLAAEIIADLTDPSSSLTELAARHKITLENLSLFLTRPDIAERLENLHLICASRIRLIAADLLPRALGGLDTVLTSSRAQLEADAAAPTDQQRTPEQRHRTIETTRRAASRILSAANFNPIPLFTRPVPRAPRADTSHAPPQSAADHPSQPPTSPPAPQASSPPPPAHTPASSKPTPIPLTPIPPRLQPQSRPIPNRPHPPQPSKHAATPAFLHASAGAATALLDPPTEHWP